MRRGILSFIYLLSFSTGFAQSWCPPGATWTYTHSNGWTHEGFARYAYVGDTLIAGTPAQIISMHAEGYDWPLQNNFSWDLGPYYTSVDGDLVSLWTGSSFDTLYHFGASIGDRWRMNVPDGTDPIIEFTVTDTGTVVIDGAPLRSLAISSDGWWQVDTIIERLGTLHQQLVPWNMILTDQLNGPLHCYQDDDINYQAPSWLFGCESWLGGEDLARDSRPGSLFPNPGTDYFTLQLPRGLNTITVYDAVGRLVLTQPSPGGTTRIEARTLSAGLHMIRIDAGDGRVLRSRWMKE